MRTVVPLLTLAACASVTDDAPPDDTDGAALPADIARPADGWLRGDLHFHTNHSDDAREQGGDDLGPALRIADAWRDAVWSSAHPELSPDDHLQFVAVTDHRTTVGLTDPAFEHPYLVLVGGEEFGSDGHAGIWGHRDHVPHEPQAGETPSQRIRDAIVEAHGQGGLFSANHPLYAGDLWTWPIEDLDAVEVWNGPWSLLSNETDEAALDAWMVGRDAENVAIRLATRLRGRGQNAQAVRFWQALLSLGVHVPPVGGGDRHMVLPAGLPTTYVAVGARDEQGVLDGIAAGATFVSRSPQGPQVVLEAEVDGEAFPMGAALPAGAAEVRVRWRVGRADGGTLTFWGGPLDASMPDPERVATLAVDGADAEGELVWIPPAEGGWLHAIVTDPLPTPDSPELEALVAELVKPPQDAIGGVIGAFGPLVELGDLSDPAYCDPRRWTSAKFQCMPADAEPMGSFYVPTTLQPWLSLVREGGASTGEAMGAISAAFLVPAP